MSQRNESAGGDQSCASRGGQGQKFCFIWCFKEWMSRHKKLQNRSNKNRRLIDCRLIDVDCLRIYDIYIYGQRPLYDPQPSIYNGFAGHWPGGYYFILSVKQKIKKSRKTRYNRYKMHFFLYITHMLVIVSLTTTQQYHKISRPKFGQN